MALMWCLAACDAGNGRQETAPIRYTEHLICVLETDGGRWQHMYRLDMARPAAEFVGGLGKRIYSLHSANLTATATALTLSFELPEQAEAVNLTATIHLVERTYALAIEAAGNAPRAYRGGQCSLLEGQILLPARQVSESVDMPGWLATEREVSQPSNDECRDKCPLSS